MRPFLLSSRVIHTGAAQSRWLLSVTHLLCLLCPAPFLKHQALRTSGAGQHHTGLEQGPGVLTTDTVLVKLEIMTSPQLCFGPRPMEAEDPPDHTLPEPERTSPGLTSGSGTGLNSFLPRVQPISTAHDPMSLSPHDSRFFLYIIWPLWDSREPGARAQTHLGPRHRP